MAQFLQRFRRKGPSKAMGRRDFDGKLTFIVPDRSSLGIASEALAKVRLPDIPHLSTLQEAYSVGNKVLQRLTGKGIKIVERKGASREEAYKQNEETIKALAETRDALANVVSDMVQPAIKTQGEIAIEQYWTTRKLIEIDQRLHELERMTKEVYDKSPEIPPLPGGRQVFRGPLKEAGALVHELYNKDLNSSIRHYKDLRDASDMFFERHIFAHKPTITKDQFYENVKKANWGPSIVQGKTREAGGMTR